MSYKVFKKIAYLFLLICGVILWNQFINQSIPTCKEQLKKRIYPFEIKGFVVKKYIKELSHGARMIDIQFKDSTFSWSLLSSQESEMWKSIKIGDFISKEKNSYIYQLKSDSLSKEFDIECSQFDSR